MAPVPVQVHFDSPRSRRPRQCDGSSRRLRPHRRARKGVCRKLSACESRCQEGSVTHVNNVKFSGRAWLTAGIKAMACKPNEDSNLLKNIFSVWKHTSINEANEPNSPGKPQTSLWNPRTACMSKDTYSALLENVRFAQEAPSVESVPLPPLRGVRRVRFNLTACSVHEIIPYSEIYGDHPRTFVFDRWSRKIPAAPCGFVSLECWITNCGDKDDEELHNETNT
mmetsp:Transcript_109408/g.172851  ORF Transcript_109408/g.172851 Transcript_109408/m.172851 type:complete len:224 (-) Transcript_109408:216-887(-)